MNMDWNEDEAGRLNQECLSFPVDRGALERALAAEGMDAVALRHSHPHLFAETCVFVSARAAKRMAQAIAAIEAVSALPAYRAAVLAHAPDIARFDPGYPAVCMGYDFHLTPGGPRLIEINTNAGGLLLNARLSLSQSSQSCRAFPLPGLPEGVSVRPPGDVREEILDMFRSAWHAYRERHRQGDAELKRLVLVDENPEAQFLAPEFALFCRLFAAAGIEAQIADPRQLLWDGETLTHNGKPVDMVYNRLTDFALAAPALAHLRAAYASGRVALTPHPRAHALYADKRNLVFLSDPAWLAAAGIAAETRDILLATIPRTLLVSGGAAHGNYAAHGTGRTHGEHGAGTDGRGASGKHGAENGGHGAGDFLWQTRKRWFFKPAAGFGSRAAYRGDKLTHRVFEEILAGGYVAQALEPPSTRRFLLGETCLTLKADLRNYAFQGRVQLAAARLYQGQTTNSRTPGGGFALLLETRAPEETKLVVSHIDLTQSLA
jgi:hypothetical protein